MPLQPEEWNGISPRLGSVEVKCTTKNKDSSIEYGFDKNGFNTDGFDKDGFDKNVEGNRVLIPFEDNDDITLNNENGKFIV